MKKYSLLLLIIIFSVSFLIGCDREISEKIVLPSVKEVTSIEINDRGSKFISNDKDVILELIDKISGLTITNEESLQDVPSQESYIEINLVTKDNINTFFMYFDEGVLKLEQPYVGIFLVDNDLKELINGIHDFNLKDE